MVATPVSRAAVTCIGIHSTWPEPQATEFAHQRRLSGNVVTFFDWGEYAIWNMPSAIKVSMDGRRETVYSDRTIDRHLQLYLGEERGLAYLEELRPHFVTLPRMLPVVRTLQDRAWVRLFEGPALDPSRGAVAGRRLRRAGARGRRRAGRAVLSRSLKARRRDPCYTSLILQRTPRPCIGLLSAGYSDCRKWSDNGNSVHPFNPGEFPLATRGVLV